MYIIYERYDVDGGFGDAVAHERAVAAVKTESEAQAYVDRYSCEHVYDVPYAELSQGLLYYRELKESNIDDDLDYWIYTTENWLKQVSFGLDTSVEKLKDHLAKLLAFKDGYEAGYQAGRK